MRGGSIGALSHVTWLSTLTAASDKLTPECADAAADALTHVGNTRHLRWGGGAVEQHVGGAALLPAFQSACQYGGARLGGARCVAWAEQGVLHPDAADRGGKAQLQAERMRVTHAHARLVGMT